MSYFKNVNSWHSLPQAASTHSSSPLFNICSLQNLNSNLFTIKLTAFYLVS